MELFFLVLENNVVSITSSQKTAHHDATACTYYGINS